MVGAMPMPSDFPYRDVYMRGYPQHPWYDRFRLKHPAMDCSQRAKLFSPFDALKGFDEAIASKEVLYENRLETDEGDKEELNRRLNILHNLTVNSRMARANRVTVTLTYFVPCTDRHHEAYGYRGQYATVTGIVWGVASSGIRIGNMTIRLEDVLTLESNHTLPGQEQPIFDTFWEE